MLGEPEGIYIGYSLDTGRSVYLKPALASQGVKGSVTNALAAAFVGSLGGGKSFSNNMIVYYSVLFGAQALIVDPKAECRATHSGLHKRHIIISNFSKKKAQSHLNDTIMPLFLHFISSMPGC